MLHLRLEIPQQNRISIRTEARETEDMETLHFSCVILLHYLLKFYNVEGFPSNMEMA